VICWRWRSIQSATRSASVAEDARKAGGTYPNVLGLQQEDRHLAAVRLAGQ
jgi:hypothetical protein